jgi:hypothetical protein
MPSFEPRRVAAITPSDLRSGCHPGDPTISDALLDGFAIFCLAESDTDVYKHEACVVAIQWYLDTRASHSHPSHLPLESCQHAPCSCSHPPNECCICHAPHPISCCLHVLGLSDTLQSTLGNFKKLC